MLWHPAPLSLTTALSETSAGVARATITSSREWVVRPESISNFPRGDSLNHPPNEGDYPIADYLDARFWISAYQSLIA